jgi:hypothetical protein
MTTFFARANNRSASAWLAPADFSALASFGMPTDQHSRNENYR